MAAASPFIPQPCHGRDPPAWRRFSAAAPRLRLPAPAPAFVSGAAPPAWVRSRVLMNAPVINAEVLAEAGGGGLLGKGIFGLHQVPGKALGRAGRALGAPQGAQINFHVSAFPEPPPPKWS